MVFGRHHLASLGDAPFVPNAMSVSLNDDNTCMARRSGVYIAKPPFYPCPVLVIRPKDLVIDFSLPVVSTCDSHNRLIALTSALLVVAQVTKVTVSGGADRPENPFFVLQDWINDLFFPATFKQSTIDRLGVEGAHYLLTYLRDLAAGTFLYYFTAGMWHVWIYWIKGKEYFDVSPNL